MDPSFSVGLTIACEGRAGKGSPVRATSAPRCCLQPRAMAFAGKSRLLAAVAATLLGWAGLVSSSTQAGSQAKRPASSQPTESPVPFLVGEKLEYRAGWVNFLTAATTRLEVTERRPFYGGHAWHFQAVAHTVEPVRYLYILDDQFDSYTDTATLASLQYESYLREQGKQQDSVVRMTTDRDPPRGDGPTVRVLPGTRDPLGLLYYFRTLDWRTTKEVRVPVYDGRKLYDVQARLEIEQGNVTVPAGNFPASRIEVRVFDRGRELTEARFWVWLAKDAPRTPVLMEAELPFGSVRVELSRATRPTGNQ